LTVNESEDEIVQVVVRQFDLRSYFQICLKIIIEVGTRHSKGWRDYFYELAIRKYKRENLKPDKQVAENI
jgi:hypothetical protein